MEGMKRGKDLNKRLKELRVNSKLDNRRTN